MSSAPYSYDERFLAGPPERPAADVTMRAWRLRSRAIDEVVRAPDQFVAWDTLRERDVTEFGLITTAEPDESGDPIPVRTSALMFSWGRDADAESLIEKAIASGLPDTTKVDRAFRPRRKEA